MIRFFDRIVNNLMSEKQLKQKEQRLFQQFKRDLLTRTNSHTTMVRWYDASEARRKRGHAGENANDSW